MIRSDMHTNITEIWIDELCEITKEWIPKAEIKTQILKMVEQVKYIHCHLEKRAERI